MNGISSTAAKYIYKKIVNANKRGEKIKSPREIVEEESLWLVDEWTHVGFIIVICLENLKLVEAFKSGNDKILNTLLGKTIRYSNMTVDAELVQQLIPGVIAAYF